MNAETIAKALGGHRAGLTWMARCPAHEDRNPSLSISAAKDGKVLVRCHAGCSQRNVIAALAERGLWRAVANNSTGRFARKRRIRIGTESDFEARARTNAAHVIWRASQVAVGSVVETYLHSRGIIFGAPATLRFRAALKHPSGGTWPAMVALVTEGLTGSSIAIHRTYLSRDGRGQAPVDPPKMMLGPCSGGVVRLGEPDGVLMVGEGIETCLSAMQATGCPAWAALSTSGLRSLDLPRSVRDVVVLADGDDPGEAAAQNCARRWQQEGRCIRIARPPSGMDFNDLLQGRNPFFTEGAQ
jgi:putative DNA primase/helicase